MIKSSGSLYLLWRKMMGSAGRIGANSRQLVTMREAMNSEW